MIAVEVWSRDYGKVQLNAASAELQICQSLWRGVKNRSGGSVDLRGAVVGLRIRGELVLLHPRTSLMALDFSLRIFSPD